MKLERKVAIGASIAVVIIAIIGVIYNYKFWNPPVVEPEPIVAEEKVFSKTVRSQFEGTEEMTFMFAYSTGDVIVTDVNPTTVSIVDRKTNSQNIIRISYEGGRGYTLDDYWREVASMRCVDCLKQTNTFEIKSSTGMQTYEGNAKKIILLSSPIGSSWTYDIEMVKPLETVEAIMKTLEFTMPN
ncbi:MAG: hypothetical protein K0S38_44 [Candidatus Paceibacter sp.]|jgi:hypothetical protein|nr:hypothetical protein [Candidatus Paceibacter sp.]